MEIKVGIFQQRAAPGLRSLWSSGAVLVAQSHHLLLHHEVAAHQQPGRSRLVQPAEGSDLAGHAGRRHHRQDRQRARFRAPVQAQSSQLRRAGPTPGYANLVKALFHDDEMIFVPGVRVGSP